MDDDRVILATLEVGLHDAGYEVSVAGSAKEAVDLMAKSPPDLVILDVRMPGMDGVELAGYLRERTNIPFLFLSAYGDVDLVRTAVAQGALGYLLKPIDIPNLIPSVAAALARGREIERLRDAETRLKTALATEQKTRTAVGVLMERQRLDPQTAFETLRRHARSQRRKITEVADEVINAAQALNIPPVECRKHD
ncbi:MAG TPA: response regulator [Steroidobacteraceae bacterium]|nr:response regulator [Steroidobacteraceae bacterium]